MGLIFCNVKTTHRFYALFLHCSKRWFIQWKLCTLIFSLNKTTYGVVKKRRIETIRRFYIAENQAHSFWKGYNLPVTILQFLWLLFKFYHEVLFRKFLKLRSFTRLYARCSKKTFPFVIPNTYLRIVCKMYKYVKQQMLKRWHMVNSESALSFQSIWRCFSSAPASNSLCTPFLPWCEQSNLTFSNF